jgi:hypothetical protein
MFGIAGCWGGGGGGDGQGLKDPFFGASFRITKEMSGLPMRVS